MPYKGADDTEPKSSTTEGFKFCIDCGAEVPMSEPSCGYDSKEQWLKTFFRY